MTYEEALRILATSAQKSSRNAKNTGHVFMLQFSRQWDEIETKIIFMLKDSTILKRLKEMDKEERAEVSNSNNTQPRSGKTQGPTIDGR